MFNLVPDNVEVACLFIKFHLGNTDILTSESVGIRPPLIILYSLNVLTY